MNSEPSLLTLASACFCLLTSLAQAQDGALASSFNQRENIIPSNTVTTSVSPTGGGTAAGGGAKAAGKSFTLTATPSATLKDVFLDWTVNGVVVNSKSPYTFTPAASETVVANFGFSITTSSSPAAGGKTTGADVYPSGQDATVTATPNDCYDFTGWTKAGQTAVLSTDTSYTFPAVATEALVANFKLKEDQITTSSSPVSGGTTTGAKTYGCDTTVTVSAKAANGYKFNGWTSNNVEVSAKNPYSFEASGAEALTAVFEDISVPTVAFTSPKASESVTTPFLTISGTANNVLGVSSVVVKVGGVPVAVSGANDWSNWTASVVLSPGANVIEVYALSEVETPSKTATITVTDTSTGNAPFALAGLIAQVTQNANAPFQVSFGTATYEQFSANPNQITAVGNYTYTQTGANTATLVLTAFAPPNQTGQPTSTVSLTFTSPTAANFTDDSGDSGTVSLSPGSTQDFSSLSGWTIVEQQAAALFGTTYFGDGVFTNIDGNGTNTSAFYTSMQYGPLATMEVETNGDPYVGGVETNFTMFAFTSAGNGSFFVTHYDGAGDPPAYVSGTFTGTYQASGLNYVAPASLNGMSAVVTQTLPNAGTPFTVTFGQATAGLTTTTTSQSAAVLNYTYTRSGRNSALLTLNNYLPTSSGAGGSYELIFESSTSVAFNGVSASGNDSGGKVALTILPESDYFAPAAVPKGTVVFNASVAHHGGTASLKDGNFTIQNASGGGSSYGTYTYAQYSPTVGMLILTHTDPSDAGDISDLQLTFNSASGGSVLGDAYDTNVGGSSVNGTFTFSQ